MNLAEAARYYKLAADQKNPVGECNYGVCLALGKGVEQGIRKAIECLRRSGGQGFLLVQTKLDYFTSLRRAGPSPIQRPHFVSDFAIGFDDTTVVAVKSLKDPSGSEVDVLTKSMKEVEAMIHLGCSNILPIIGFNLPRPGSPARVETEFAVGGRLRVALDQELRHSPLDGTGIAIIVCGLLEGTRFLHANGIVHRDPTQEDIMLNEHFHVQIAISRAADWSTWTLRRHCGSVPRFMWHLRWTIMCTVHGQSTFSHLR
jgi:serine/threonine protein kinase